MTRLRWWRRHDEIPVVELGRTNPVRFAIVMLIVLAIAVFFGFTKHIPFKHGFRLNAVFATAVNIHSKSPVRIAGVNVGKVTNVQARGINSFVTMDIKHQYAPIPVDTRAILREKTLLGEAYVGLSTGTGSGPKFPDGGTISATHVESTQQLDSLTASHRSNDFFKNGVNGLLYVTLVETWHLCRYTKH